MMTQPQRPDWNLIVAIISVVITVVLGFPSLYVFVEERFLLQTTSPQQQNAIDSGRVTW